MFNRKSNDVNNFLRKSNNLLMWFFAGLLSTGAVQAQTTEFTSFEGADSGDILIGTVPLSAAFVGGNAGRRGVPAYYQSGSFAWHIDQESTAEVVFTTPASEVDFWFRDTVGGGPVLIRVIDVEGTVISEATGTQVFTNLVVTRTEDQTLIDRIEFENPGSRDSVVDDFAFTAAVPDVDVPEPTQGPIADPIGTGSVTASLADVVSGLTAPVVTINSPVESNTLYIADQAGVISALNQETGRTSTFLDVSDFLVNLGAIGPVSFDERGLLGFAFHPDYASNGLVYTYTSEPVSDTPDFSTQPAGTTADHQTVINEWQVTNASDPATAVDRTTRRELLRLDQPQFNHNGGALVFDSNSLLYIARGDGGGADDADGQDFIDGPIIGHGTGNANNTANPYGSILRIDPFGNSSANGQYGIPTDNPFFGVDGVVSEIYAYGFRNPYRISFDPDTGDLWVADVGQNFIEEINVVVAGGNYGWNEKEGSFSLEPNGSGASTVTSVDPGVSADLIDPVAEYDRDEGLAIIGGFVYRGSQIPDLEGHYVFGDFGQFNGSASRLFYLDGDDVIKEFSMADDTLQSISMTGIGIDNDGELYIMGNSTGTPFGSTGRVLRLDPATSDSEQNGDSSADGGDDNSADGGDDSDADNDDEDSGGGGGGSTGIAMLGLVLLAWIRPRRRLV